MPTYEMPLLLRLANKTEYVNTLKDIAKSIFETGGFIRKIENWGIKELPCKTNAHNSIHTHANHFMFSFDSPPSQVVKIQDDCRRNRSIIRVRIYLENVVPENVKCTFAEEMLPPAYRPSVQKLLEQAKKHKRYQTKFKYNSGLDYYPFMR